ncbi:hypothetical protein MPSEU_000212900 [Mayamaea pseudoterrestris]|nr:hypothetical protein MPSEU_000212900 [Mayamaea pseudoterrestris]
MTDTAVDDDDSKIFPQRLMEILTDERNADSICWLPNGRRFIVRSRPLFQAQIMPRYFSRKAKFSSFTRKLNRWNFVRVSSGPEAGAYQHEHFLRDQPHLVTQMFCKNARSKMAMAEPICETMCMDYSSGAVQSSEHTAAVEPNQQHNQQQLLALGIPLSLLETLVKPDPQQQRRSPAQPGGLMLQQSQYANLLLERQIQILQEEQVKHMLHLVGRKPAAPMSQDLLRLQHNMQSNAQRHKQSPTNHRASAA